LKYASIIDGKLAMRERKLLKQAHETCGIEYDIEQTQNLRKQFISGKMLNVVIPEA